MIKISSKTHLLFLFFGNLCNKYLHRSQLHFQSAKQEKEKENKNVNKRFFMRLTEAAYFFK